MTTCCSLELNGTSPETQKNACKYSKEKIGLIGVCSRSTFVFASTSVCASNFKMLSEW